MIATRMVVAAFLFPAGLAAQVAVVNPGIPAEETCVYARTTAGKTETLTLRLSLRNDAAGPSYLLESRAPDSEATLRLDPVTLFATRSDVLSRSPESTVRRTTEILAVSGSRAPDVVVVAGTESMTTTLRGFPFGKLQKAKLGFVGSGSGGGTGGFELEFSVVGKETIVAAGRSWECWKAQIGLGGIFSMFGKTSLWFSVQAPNVLVRTEGATGPPGSPQSVLELRSYSSSGAPWTPAVTPRK